MTSIRRRLTVPEVSALLDETAVNALLNETAVNALLNETAVNSLILSATVNSLIELSGAGAIGSYALLAHKNPDVGGSVGDIFAADELYYVGFQTSDSESSWTNSYPIAAAGVVAGNTWELCGKTEALGTTDDRLRASLFRRIS